MDVPLVGRHRELRRFAAMEARAARGRSCAVMLLGDPGLGKTSLLRAMQRRATAQAVFVPGADRRLEGTPGGIAQLVALPLTRRPVQRAFGRHLDQLRSEAPPARAAAILACLHAVGPPPLVVLVDDLDELDDADRMTVVELVRQAGRVPLVLVAAARRPVTGWPTAAVRLWPLPDGAIGELLSREGLHDEAVERIRPFLAGNPLAADFLVASLTDEEQAGMERLRDPLPVGPRLVAAHAGALAGLSATDREAALERAAQARFEDEAADPASRGGSERATSWVHAATLAAALPAERRQAHARLAGRASGPVALLHRAAAAGQPDDDLARALAAAAVDQAVGDLPGAIELLVAAGEVAEDPAMTGDAWYRAAVAGYLTGQHRRVLELVTALRRLECSGVAGVHLDRVDGLAGFHVYGVAPVIADLEASAQRATERGDTGAALTLLLIAGVFALYACQFEQLSSLADQAASLEGTDPLSRATVAVFSASADLYTRTDAQALRALGPVLAGLADAEPPPQPIPDLDLDVSRSMFYGGLLFMTDEHWDRARSLLGRAVRRDRAAGWTGLEGLNVAWYAEVLWRVGAWDDAIRLAQDALDGHGDALGRSRLWVDAFYAKAALLTGDAAAAARHREAVEADAGSPLNVPLVQLVMHAGTGTGLLGDGDPERALEHLRAARALAGPVGHPGLVWCRAELVEALAATGNRAEARAEAELLASTLAVGAPPVLAGRVLRARGLASGGRRGLGALRRAVGSHERGGSPFELARSLLLLAEAHDALGEPSDAVAPASRSAEMFERLGAVPFASRARRVGTDAGRLSDRLSGLTSREADVARLVAGGATNREAAAVLGMSPKTVSYHLGTVFRKMRVTSRSQLAARLRAG